MKLGVIVSKLSVGFIGLDFFSVKLRIVSGRRENAI
jgi:hypothetical protein